MQTPGLEIYETGTSFQAGVSFVPLEPRLSLPSQKQRNLPTGKPDFLTGGSKAGILDILVVLASFTCSSLL